MRFKDYFNQQKVIKEIKYNFKRIILELGLYNSSGQYPNDLKIKFNKYGYYLEFNISGITSFSKIENNIDFISNCLKAYELICKNKKGLVTLYVYTKTLEELNFNKIKLDPYKLLLGYNYNGPIIADMSKGAHLLISGLPGQGKTGLIKALVSNIDAADVILINCFKDDFKNIKVTFIDGSNNILKYLNRLLENSMKRKRPLYIVLEELMTLDNKSMNDTIKKLLAIGRHLNIFIIGIIQIATKENCKYKDLFNYRLTFKQVDTSSYNVILGISVPNKNLKKREFYFLGDDLYKGYTYTLN